MSKASQRINLCKYRISDVHLSTDTLQTTPSPWHHLLWISQYQMKSVRHYQYIYYICKCALNITWEAVLVLQITQKYPLNSKLGDGFNTACLCNNKQNFTITNLTTRHEFLITWLEFGPLLLRYRNNSTLSTYVIMHAVPATSKFHNR